MSDELDRLRADLEVLRKFTEDGIEWDLAELIDVIETRVRKLEAEADPWREAREWIEKCRETTTDIKTKRQIAFVDHLTAEVERLEKRVAELEVALIRIATVPDCGCVQCRGQCDSAENLRVNAEEIREIARNAVEDVKLVADMQPPFEGPIESIEPVLDPARVLLTAIGILAGQSEFRASAFISDAMFRSGISSDKPYKLKGGVYE